VDFQKRLERPDRGIARRGAIVTFAYDAFAACFDPAMPGVVQMTWGSGSSDYVQFFADPVLDADGIHAIQRRAYLIQGLATAIGSLGRGDTVTLGGQAYRCVTTPLNDGFGVVTIHLEPAATS
jgi:hypothetical protein